MGLVADSLDMLADSFVFIGLSVEKPLKERKCCQNQRIFS
jgi:Co/Zn/Cd efflux system component